VTAEGARPMKATQKDDDVLVWISSPSTKLVTP
jgi:hypothetical protein